MGPISRMQQHEAAIRERTREFEPRPPMRCPFPRRQNGLFDNGLQVAEPLSPDGREGRARSVHVCAAAERSAAFTLVLRGSGPARPSPQGPLVQTIGVIGPGRYGDRSLLAQKPPPSCGLTPIT
jgi:hypothetical protein